jgi:tetratricopeptide (TPR) repeat protein
MSMRRTPLAASSLLTVLVLAGPARAVDTLTLVPGSTVKAPGNQIRGTIQAESPTEVRIKPPTGAEQAVPIDQIDSIAYENPGPSYGLAESRAAGGDLAGALDLYRKAATEASGKPYVAQAAQFQALKTLAQLAAGSPARLGEAISGLDAFVKANPQSRHRGPALEVLARLQLQKGDADAADRTVADLEKLPWAKDRAAVLRAEVLTRRGKHDEALTQLDKILADAPKGSSRARDAQLSKAKALAAAHKFDDSEALVRQVIKDAPPEDAEVQAVAWNTLGDCLRAANKPKAALDAYLHTEILYEKDKEQRPRAMYEIAQLWRLLKRDDRADEMMENLKREFPQSPYATSRAAAR